jgi:hypothetical protein
VIYSRWDPVSGEYDLFEAPMPLAALNDDLPVPSMPPQVAGNGGKIGVPSVECGRVLPAGAKHIGRSEFAEGSITPPQHVKLGATESAASGFKFDLFSFFAGAAAIGVVWLFMRETKR